MTCQRIEGSESSSQCMTDSLGSGTSRWGVLAAICCHLFAPGKETISSGRPFEILELVTDLR